MRFALISFFSVVVCAFTACEKHPLPESEGVKSIAEEAGKGHGHAGGDAHGQKPAGHGEAKH